MKNIWILRSWIFVNIVLTFNNLYYIYVYG